MVYAFFPRNIHTLSELLSIFIYCIALLYKNMLGQNKNILILLTFLFVILLCSACKKERVEFPWTATKLPTEYALSDVRFINPNEGFVTSGLDWTKGEIFFTLDGGTNWELGEESDFRFSALDTDINGDIHAIGYVGKYVKKDASGWESQFVNVYDPFDDIATWDGHIKFIVSGGIYSNGTISKIDYWGNVLSRDTFENSFEAVDFIDETHAIASGYGQVWRTDDIGVSWYPLDISGDYFKDVQFPTSEVGYICGYSGSILKSTDGGYTWNSLRNGDKILVKDKRFNALHFEDAQHGYMVGNNGLCWRTVNGGRHWQVVKKLPPYDFTGVFVVDDRAFLASQEGFLVTVIHG